MAIRYTEELVKSVNKYNKNLEGIAKKIFNLKINFNDIEMRHLYALSDCLSVINNIKSRKLTEKFLYDVINEYGYC